MTELADNAACRRCWRSAQVLSWLGEIGDCCNNFKAEVISHSTTEQSERRKASARRGGRTSETQITVAKKEVREFSMKCGRLRHV